MDDLIYLASERYEKDSIGQMVPMESYRAIWADIRSITRSEWANAGQSGLNPQLVAITPVANYDGEDIALVRKRKYGIYRTYLPPNSDEIELYLELKAGLDEKINICR